MILNLHFIIGIPISVDGCRARRVSVTVSQDIPVECTLDG